jgi:hypothetical protein
MNFYLHIPGAFFAANAAKNRALRSKSSDLHKQILRAFRSSPLRALQRQVLTGC